MCTSDASPAGALATFDGPILEQPASSFADLVAPLSAAAFIDGFWGARPLFVKRNHPGYFDGLVTVADAATLLSTAAFHSGEVRVARDGGLLDASRFTESGQIDNGKVWSHYAEGATVIFEHLDRKHARLLQLTTACEELFRVPFRTNAYLTPAASRGFGLHYDTHDVLILQVSGSKTWQVHDSPVQLPHEEQKCNAERVARSRRIAEIRLEPGDVLYLPRGYIHGASANEDVSFHVTIGIRALTLHDVFSTALRRMLVSRSEFRQVCLFDGAGARLAAAREALLANIGDVDLMKALLDADLSFMHKRTRPFRGRLLQSLQPPRIGHGTPLRLAPGALARMREVNDGVVLAFDKRTLRFPAGSLAALERVLTRQAFLPAELPGLGADDGLQLAGKLFECRLLEVA